MLPVCVITGCFVAVRRPIQASGMLSYAGELEPSIVQIVYAVTWRLHPVAPHQTMASVASVFAQPTSPPRSMGKRWEIVS